MYPVLFTVFGFPIQSYGVGKALAAIVAGLVLARAFRRRGDGAVNPDTCTWSNS